MSDEKKGNIVTFTRLETPSDPYTWPADVKPQEFGASITLESHVASLFDGEWGQWAKDIREQQDRLQAWMWARMQHSMHQARWGNDGVETLDGCPLCAWDYRHAQFWREIVHALTQCDYCWMLNWQCQQRCETYCESECGCRKCRPDEE